MINKKSRKLLAYMAFGGNQRFPEDTIFKIYDIQLKTILLSLLFLSGLMLLPTFGYAEELRVCVNNTNGMIRASETELCRPNETEEFLSSGSSQAEIKSLKSRLDVVENAIGLLNEPPTIRMSRLDVILLKDESYRLSAANISDDGLIGPLQVTWTAIETPSDDIPFPEILSPDVISTPVSFYDDGLAETVNKYRFEVAACDGQYCTREIKYVVVHNSNKAPSIDSTFPSGWITEDPINNFPDRCDLEFQIHTSDDGFDSPLTSTLVFNGVISGQIADSTLTIRRPDVWAGIFTHEVLDILQYGDPDVPIYDRVYDNTPTTLSFTFTVFDGQHYVSEDVEGTCTWRPW